MGQNTANKLENPIIYEWKSLIIQLHPLLKDNIDSSILEIYYCYKLISVHYKNYLFGSDS
ncbi:UNVERIFIED_ORG: hypothetical protein ABIC97_003828 [Peribacillus simplex]